jgi:hypothetical protein
MRDKNKSFQSEKKLIVPSHEAWRGGSRNENSDDRVRTHSLVVMFR